MDMNQIAAEIAYADGYEAGKQAAAEEILETLEKVKANCIDCDGYFLYGQFMNLYLDVKKKYGVQ